MGQFMEYVARSSTVAEVPAARVAYLGVLTSLASGPQGAQVTATKLEAQLHCIGSTAFIETVPPWRNALRDSRCDGR